MKQGREAEGAASTGSRAFGDQTHYQGQDCRDRDATLLSQRKQQPLELRRDTALCVSVALGFVLVGRKKKAE